MSDESSSVAFHVCLLAIGLFLVVFGGYLIYEKGWLAIDTGMTEQRAGVLVEADEPAMFWASTVFDMVMGTLVAGFGLAFFVWGFLGVRKKNR